MSTQANKQVRSTYITPAFRVSYPELFVPTAGLDADNPNAKKKYSITMLFPKAAKVAELKAATHPAARYMADDNCRGFYAEICKIARANFGPEVDLSTLVIKKFRDGDKPKQSGKTEENEKGYVVVRTTSVDKPQVTRGDKSHVTDPGEVYAGCWARAVLTIAPYVTKVSRGVTVYLIGIQKLADDVAFSNRPRVEDIFDEVVADTDAPATVENEASDLPF